MYIKNRQGIVSNFIGLLKALEDQGCFRGCRNSWLDRGASGIEICFGSNLGMVYLENALQNYSIDDIQTLCDELKMLSNKNSVINEQRNISNKLGAEIKQIKDSLGIE